ncbi:hypothetical protein C8R44DRAFT_864614 [Mycena epipterygia]|nr:hypothetical protein C8R44DRAFT_864614 [Mycena epipterygia]
MHSVADLRAVQILKLRELRRLPMLPYEKQLDLTRDVVVKAYKNFPGTQPSCRRMPSPQQYNYRTKLTPHFEAPTKTQRLDLKNPKNDTKKPE